MDSLTEEWQETLRKWQAFMVNTSCGPQTKKLSQAIQNTMHHCEFSLATFREAEESSSDSPIMELENTTQALETFMSLHIFIEALRLGLGHASSGHGTTLRSVEREVNAACKDLHKVLSRVIAHGVELLNAVIPVVETKEAKYQTLWLRARDGKKGALQLVERLEERGTINSEQARPSFPTSNPSQPYAQTLMASDSPAHTEEMHRSSIRGTATAAD